MRDRGSGIGNRESHFGDRGAGIGGRKPRTPAAEPRTPDPGPRRDSGFTLVELVVVLFLLALAAGLALPAAGRGVETIQLRADVAGIASFLRYGREQAVTTRERREVRIEPDARSLSLLAADNDAPLRTRQISPRLRVQADPPGASTVTFSPQGLTSGGSFRVEGPSRGTYLITVDPMTGRVTTQRLDS